MRLSKRRDVDPLKIAWLLRADLRQDESIDGPISERFKMWWLVNGSREYAPWTEHAVLKEAGLFQAEPGWSSYEGFGMTPALRFLLEIREDLAQKFDVSTNDGLWEAIAWLFVHGVREHELFLAVDDKTLLALDKTPPVFIDSDAVDITTPDITWLMFFVWNINSNLKNQYNLKNVQDRQAYLKWFLLDGVRQLALTPLILPRWHKWLCDGVISNQAGSTVPRAAYLLWERHQQLQQAFDLKTERGITALAMWSKEVWNTQQELSWINHSAVTLCVEVPVPIKRPFGVNLIGFAFGELGIGEDVRMAAAACEAAGIPYTVVNIHPGDTLRQADSMLAEQVERNAKQADLAPYCFNLFCLTAFDTARIYLEQGENLFGNRYNIGWWPWELPVWPHHWNFVFNLVDEVWAATDFTNQVYQSAALKITNGKTKVTLMPMAASVKRAISLSRSDVGLPAEKFLFIYVFDFKSYLERKNPFATVKAFRQAFKATDNSVGLVIKTMNTDLENSDWRRFLGECGKDNRIYLIDETMERSQVLGLINACDVYISLHRSEGLGRTLVEAMLFGKSVIATDFSGNVDFLNKENGFPVNWHTKKVESGEYPFVTKEDNAWWADPDLNSAIEKMRLARLTHNNPNFIKKLAETTEERFSPRTIGTSMKRYLKILANIEFKSPSPN